MIDQSNAAGLLNEFLSLSSTDLKWIPQLRRISCDLRLKIGDLFPFQSTVEKLLSFLSNGDSRVKSKSFESISRLALFGKKCTFVCMYVCMYVRN